MHSRIAEMGIIIKRLYGDITTVCTTVTKQSCVYPNDPAADNQTDWGPGLGKTFLSVCIAGFVSAGGCSVVYDTAANIFANFEAQKFSRDAVDSRQGRSDVKRYQACDLLIVDDLGSEMTTQFVQASLYALVNARLVAGKGTVISSNLSIEDIRRRYSPQVASRLDGEYRALTFFGEDIRLVRKNQL